MYTLHMLVTQLRCGWFASELLQTKLDSCHVKRYGVWGVQNK